MRFSEQLRAALAVQWVVFRRSPVVLLTSVFLVVGIALIALAALYSAGGDSAMAVKSAAMMPDRGWGGLFAIVTQVIAVAGLLAFGVVAGWFFGREFSDGTVGGLFALPVSRQAIAVAKLLLLLAWAVVASLVVAAVTLGIGLMFGFQAPAFEVLQHAVKLVCVSLLTALLSSPSALAATVWRGYLPSIGIIIGIMVCAQVAVMFGVSAWVPFAAPGVWAASTVGVPDLGLAIQLVAAVPVAALFSLFVVRSWRRLQLA